MVRRPLALQEVAAETRVYRDFGRHLKDFLHEFEQAKKRAQSLAPMLANEPRFLAQEFKEGRICDAFIAATADYLSRVNGLNTPIWALNESRVLEKPWFSEEWPELRLRLLRDTPSAFKDKNIFVFDSALNVA